MISFKTQFDKLTRAYIAGEVDPYMSCACFVGNLLNGKRTWDNIRYYAAFGRSILYDIDGPSFVTGALIIDEESEGMYTPEEILHLENTFIRTLEEQTIGDFARDSSPRSFLYPFEVVPEHPDYEEALFKAFSVTLDALRKMHESKGEKVDDFQFVKRELKVA